MSKPGENLSGCFASAPSCNKCRENTKWIAFPSGTRHLSLVQPLKVVRCSDCKLLFMDPRPSERAMDEIFSGVVPDDLKIYAEQPANYGAVTEQRKQLFEKRIKILSNNFDMNLNPKFLDIGASSGTMLEAAKELGWDVYGVEPSTTGVKACITKNLNVVLSKAEKLPFPDNSMEMVHSHHVFEHLDNPFEAAAEIYRVLKPGGLFFVEVPNQFDNIHFLRYRLFRRIPIRNRDIRSIHHFYFFSKSNLFNLFRDINFERVKVKSIYLSPRSGAGYIGSQILRWIGYFFLGGYLIQVTGRKPIIK